MKSAKAKETKSTIRFNAKIESSSLLSFPKTVSAKFPKGVKTIEGTINSLPFRAALEAGNKIKLSKTMQKIAHVDTEEAVAIEITRMGEELETRVPLDFRKALASAPKAKTLWEDITPLARRDWIFWIISGKKKRLVR